MIDPKHLPEKDQLFRGIITKQFEYWQLSKHLHMRGMGEVKKEIANFVKEAVEKGYTLEEFRAYCLECGATEEDLADDPAYDFTVVCFGQAKALKDSGSN